MRTDDLDDRIHALVGEAVAAAPPAAPLDLTTIGDVVPLEPRRSRRPIVWAVAGSVAVAAAVVVGIVLVNDDSPGRITTTDNTASPTVPPTTSVSVVVTAGDGGVFEYVEGGPPVRWTSERMGFAVKAPDGSMLVQRALQGDYLASPVDSMPLIQREPGGPLVPLFDELMPGADVVAGWYRIHDAAAVDGRSLLLIERQEAESRGVDTPPGVLMTVDLDTGALAVIDNEFGGWESGSSRLHLAETGLVVGETYSGASRAFYSVSVGGSTPLQAVDFGLEPSYDDCVDCPRLFAISRSGSVLMWLDGPHLIRRSLDGDTVFAPVDVGEYWRASDLSLGDDGLVVVDMLGEPEKATGPHRVAIGALPMAGWRASIA